MRRWRPIAGLLGVLLTIAGVGTARAEISATPRGGGRVDTMIMGDTGITDGVDPIPQIWHRYRNVSDDRVLNPDGETREDGWPDVAYLRGSGWPVVVWAYNHGVSHDIVMSRWEGSGWSPIEFLTTTIEDELDPRVFVRTDGTIDVVWWVAGNDPRVELTTRTTDAEPWAPVRRISEVGEPGRRPSVAFRNETLWVAYERDATTTPFNSSEIAVRRANAQGSFVLEFVAESTYDGPLSPVLHVRACRFWLDWRYSETEFAFAEIPDVSGDPVSLETTSDTSWIGLESVRRLIAGIVRQTQPPTPNGSDPLCAPSPAE